MCKHDSSRLSCQLCHDEFVRLSKKRSEQARRGYYSSNRGTIPINFLYRDGMRRCRECLKRTRERKCPDCNLPTRGVPVQAKQKRHYTNLNAESRPKRASRYSYANGEAFCKWCGVLVKENETYCKKGVTYHKDCAKMVRFRPTNSNRPEKLKVRGDAKPK